MLRYESQSERDDQASLLRRLMAPVGPAKSPTVGGAHVIAVVSGKGGVGKTLIASNLSIALAARGHRVVLLDMDFGLANADIVLGVEPACRWSDVVTGRRSIEEVVVQGPGGIAFVPGCSGVPRVANLSEFERHRLLAGLDRLGRDYEIMMLDCGAGLSRNVVGLAEAADRVLVVTTPEPTAIADAYAMIKAFAQEQPRPLPARGRTATVGVVVNQAASRTEGRETYERLAQVAARFLHVPVVDDGYILGDEHVPAAVRCRRPVLLCYPRCSASSCLMAVAGRLSRELGRPESGQSLFYRVINLFM